jgi:hypothetical protein
LRHQVSNVAYSLGVRLSKNCTLNLVQQQAESTLIPGADVVPLTEGKTDGREIASVQTARRGRRPWHVRTLHAREPGGPRFDQAMCRLGPHREGEEDFLGFSLAFGPVAGRTTRSMHLWSESRAGK